jgi:hypothetical protein
VQVLKFSYAARVIGDPKLFCGKDYIAEWQCADASVPPEAGYRKTISLHCD